MKLLTQVREHPYRHVRWICPRNRSHQPKQSSNFEWVPFVRGTLSIMFDQIAPLMAKLYLEKHVDTAIFSTATAVSKEST